MALFTRMNGERKAQGPSQRHTYQDSSPGWWRGYCSLVTWNHA